MMGVCGYNLTISQITSVATSLSFCIMSISTVGFPQSRNKTSLIFGKLIGKCAHTLWLSLK